MAPWWPADTLASKQRSLLRILSVAAVERLEVAPLVACLAMEHRGRYRRRLRRLAQRLAAHTSLADALELTPGVLSDEQILAIRFGDQSGTLPATLANLLKTEHQAAMQVNIRLRQMVFYVGITITILILMLSFMMIQIVPSFQAIFNDFELELPSLTIFLISISNFAVNYWFLIALVLLAVVWVFRAETSRRFFRRVLSSRVVPTVVALRSDLTRVRYELSQASAELRQLDEEGRALTLELRKLHDPRRLSEIAKARGFGPPERVVELP